ncbi:hypothetical protein [Ravibacter arvi]
MKRIAFYSVLILSLNSCLPQDQPNPVEDLFRDCCGTEAVEFTHQGARIYVPNVFTPNRDKVNDFFYPFTSEEDVEIQGFTIISAKGDTVLFQRDFMNYKDIENFGWNGKRPDGTIYVGLFKYGMRAISKGVLRYVEGVACAVPCGPASKSVQSNNNCFFPSQAGKAGSLDRSKPNEEKSCFE